MNIIDADGHIVETPSDLRRHLPPPYSKRTGALLPSDGMDTNMGGMLGGMEHNDVPTRLKDMDKEGIDVSVLFPTRARTTISLPRSANKVRGYAALRWSRCKTQKRPPRKPIELSASSASSPSPLPHRV